MACEAKRGEAGLELGYDVDPVLSKDLECSVSEASEESELLMSAPPADRRTA